MRTTHIIIFLWLMCVISARPLSAQSNPCGPETVVDSNGYAGIAFFNYGSITRTRSTNYKSAAAVGQNFIGYAENVLHNTSLGFYTRYLLPPFGVKVTATQGDLLDRIQISWEIDALGPASNEGFNIYRDDVFLATVGANIRSYNDFNVIAGRPYIYTVRGINVYGEGVGSDALGFQVPNGVVTGWVSTINGSPVPNASVTLTPMQGFSAQFGVNDGAFAVSQDGQHPFLPAAGDDWTLTCWLKTTSASTNASLIHFNGAPFYMRAVNSASGHEGVEIAATQNGAPFITAHFPDSSKHDWHHIALSFDGQSNQARLYIDGALMALAPMNAIATTDSLSIGAYAGAGGWNGRLDELRIYARQLDELDLGQVMDGTASSSTPNLTHYWKMDEELGERSYDIVKRHKLYFCGAAFDADRPPVHTAGVTNEDGYYSIESASYGTGTTFLATPKKNFYLHRALKFNRDESDYATLSDFALTSHATIELWVNSAGPDGTQCVLSKQWGPNEFRLLLVPSGLQHQINVNLNGQEHTFGTMGNGYHHLAFTWDQSTGQLTGYKDGVLMSAHTFTGITGDWSDPANAWVLGARKNGNTYTDFFGGLIDEVAVYDTTLSVADIQAHVSATRDIQESGLRIYFPMDEGSGNRISNVGSVLLNGGTTTGASWSAIAVHQEIEPHIFTPATRQVTLNPSVTSVDQVDFIDRSTVAVTGYVRYQNTDCFAGDVEILVNGQSYVPKIMTDSTGRFVADFDPGATFTLTPVFENHVFVPAFWEITNLNSPIAGLLFNDITTRKVSGQVAGGLCKKSIITAPPGSGQGTVCRVMVRSGDGCLERQVTIDNQEGLFEFDNLPPLEYMTIAVVEHSVQAIKAAFDTQGGSVLDLSKQDTMVEFIYRATPEVEIVSGLDPYSPNCDVIVLDQFENVSLTIKLKEQYVATQNDDGVCYLDTADFHIINGFADQTIDTAMSGGMLMYAFQTGEPNPSPPYLKTMQIIGLPPGGIEGSLVKQGVVTGIRAKENTFTTMMPEIPSLILRDPPGDESFSFLEENEKFCSTVAISDEFEIGEGGGLTLLIGGEQEFVMAPLGVGVEIDVANSVNNGFDAQLSYKRISANSFETCTSFESRIATSDQSLIVGGEQGADLYMGTALNLIFGNVDIVTFDTTQCSGINSTAVMVQPGDFATTFIYSEFYIKNATIPNLIKLANDPTADSADVARYLESIDRWTAIVESNATQKQNSRFIKNISFDAGIDYAYAETSDTTSAEAIENMVNSEFNLGSDFEVSIKGIGIAGRIHFFTNTSHGDRDEANLAQGITVGYELRDNDPLDAFTFDVGMDSVYKTPVFNLKAGQSSCPWEPGTANREGPNLQLAPGSQFTAINVPANEPAVFQLKLGNLSATNEDWTYGFTSVATSNPDGAIIKLNGQPLNYVQQFIVPYGTTRTVTVTVERGPVEYDYDSLLVAEISSCEWDRNHALSIPVDANPMFFSGIYLSAHFIRPCSEVNITVPQQDWVIFPDPLTDSIVDDNILRITVSGYDMNEPDFKLIRLQYRPSDGDGAWINIPGTFERYNPNWVNFDTLPGNPLELQPIFTQFFWQTAGLKDGLYEIRAVAVCTGDASDRPGFSQIIKGRIDREPPSLVGVPQPADGVLHVGDEISFTFNEAVNCDELIPADIMNPNNVGLYDVSTNTLIHANITCYENKIVIDPIFDNEIYENHIMRAEVHGIQDLTGNTLTFKKWEFYVDRNELAWLIDSVGLTKYPHETKTITAKIHNRGGYPVPFVIDSVPEWIHVSPDAGTLVANEILEIQFTADSTIARGDYSETIVLHTETGENPFFMGGDENLRLGVRNICSPPSWVINPALYANTMNMNIRLQVNGNFSADPEDQIGVFIDGSLRGTAKLTYLPAYTTWVAFVTVYGNSTDEGKPLVYEIFDVSACLHYPGILDGTFNFVSNSVVGSPNAPRVLSNSSMLLQEIPVKTGWNWISFNLGFPDPAINKVLNNIPSPTGDLIKDQTKFATYSNPAWSGALNSINNKSLYMYQATKNNLIKITGNALNPASVSIPIVAGWNWISYIPTYTLSVNAALGSIPATAGDVIKSQSSFAQYVNSTVGWVGSLTHMRAPNGYLLKTAGAGTIIYPPQSFAEPDGPVTRNAETSSTIWTVDAPQYEYSMTLIGMFRYDDANATASNMELGAFVENEIRGVAEAIYIEHMDAYLFFLTSYANINGEQLHFKLYDGETGSIQLLDEVMTFSPNLHQGSIETPVPFTLETTSADAERALHAFDVRPNPFRTETACQFTLPASQEVMLTISDMSGVLLFARQASLSAGSHTMVWDGHNAAGAPVVNGMYVIRLETEESIVTRKVVLHR